MFSEPLRIQHVQCRQVCIDWQPLGELQDRLSGSIMSDEDYAAFCEA